MPWLAFSKLLPLPAGPALAFFELLFFRMRNTLWNCLDLGLIALRRNEGTAFPFLSRTTLRPLAFASDSKSRGGD